MKIYVALAITAVFAAPQYSYASDKCNCENLETKVREKISSVLYQSVLKMYASPGTAARNVYFYYLGDDFEGTMQLTCACEEQKTNQKNPYKATVDNVIECDLGYAHRAWHLENTKLRRKSDGGIVLDEVDTVVPSGQTVPPT